MNKKLRKINSFRKHPASTKNGPINPINPINHLNPNIW